MADLKHGLALFSGTEQEMQEVATRIERQCHESVDCLRVVGVGREIDEVEAEYMERTRRLPRRVGIRLSR